MDRGWKTERFQCADQHILGQVFRIGGVPDPAKHQLVDAHDVVLVDGLPVRVDGGRVLSGRHPAGVSCALELDHGGGAANPSTGSNYFWVLHGGWSGRE